MIKNGMHPGEVQPLSLGEQWVLVFGGVSRAGRRRARRSVLSALESGIDVVWFDGCDEEDDEPFPSGDVNHFDVELQRIDFAAEEARSVAGRLRTGDSLRSGRLGGLLWRVGLRRVGNLLRARSAWSVVRPDVECLRGANTDPRLIVCCDDHAITSAWHAAKLWPNTSLVSSLKVPVE